MNKNSLERQYEIEEWLVRKPDSSAITGIDLFAGAGGFSCGLNMGGISVVGAVELDKRACETLRSNRSEFFPCMNVIQQDIRTLSGEELLKLSGVKELDILFGSPPCQGFSTNNSKNRGLDNPHSLLLQEFIRMVKEVKPKMFMMENVPGLFQYKDFFYIAMEEFEKCGFVVRMNMLDACGYGVPQRRKRVFIHGDRIDTGRTPEWPKYTHFDPEHIKKPKSVPVAVMSGYMFPVNGYPKEVIKDLKYNERFSYLINKKTVAEDFDRAVNEIMFESIIKNVEKSKK